MKIKLRADTLCAHDVHSVAWYRTMNLHIKPVLKAGTILKVTDCVENIFGIYYVCKIEDEYYYIPLSKAEKMNT